MKLNKLTASKSHRVLLFGPPKSGKTLLAGQLAEEFDLIWFDLEKGVETLLQLSPEAQDRVEVIQLPDTRSYPIAIETLLKVIKGGPANICHEHGKIDCPICKKNPEAEWVFVELNKLPLTTVVVFDSLTQLTNSATANITKGQPDDYKLQTDDWGNLGKLMDIFLSHVQNAPFNVVCISHETEVEMVDGKEKIVPTAGTRNFSRNSAKYFDAVVYVDVQNAKHRVGSSTTYRNNILTGTRTGIALEKSSEPSLIPIFKGEVPVHEASESAAGSQGTKAAANLGSMAERIAAMKKGAGK